MVTACKHCWEIYFPFSAAVLYLWEGVNIFFPILLLTSSQYVKDCGNTCSGIGKYEKKYAGRTATSC